VNDVVVAAFHDVKLRIRKKGQEILAHSTLAPGGHKTRGGII
jgi:hypothetical protein